jgi:hypothetical protein
MELATTFDATLPDWLIDDLDTLPRVLPTVEERMRLVNDLADRNWRAGNGGPFAAIVVDDATGELVSVGVNVVLSSGLTASLNVRWVAGTWAPMGRICLSWSIGGPACSATARRCGAGCARSSSPAREHCSRS